MTIAIYVLVSLCNGLGWCLYLRERKRRRELATWILTEAMRMQSVAYRSTGRMARERGQA